LGTTFLVREYADDPAARVFVADGRVAVQSTRQHGSHRAVAHEGPHDGPHDGSPNVPQAVLVASTLGVINDSGQVTVTPNIDAEAYTGWTTGKLVFQNTPVPQIVAELSRAYGVDIELADTTLAKQALTWRVESERNSMVQALHELTTLLGAHVVRMRGVITIVPGRRASPRSTHLPSASETQYGR
jgi:ferric-dicitrate binding protein FerR (iron transport regulator)